MNLKEIIVKIQQISSLQPNVNSIVESGNIYDLNNQEWEQRYAAVCVSQRNHVPNTNFTTYNFTLYYVDRLTIDQSNKDEVQAVAVETLTNIANQVSNQNWLLDCTKGEITVFTERFTAECAGAWMNLSVTVAVNNCVLGTYMDVSDLYYTKQEVDSMIGQKQERLVSGQNIKTINNQSILGSGNITIEGGGGSSDLTASAPLQITNSNIRLVADDSTQITRITSSYRVEPDTHTIPTTFLVSDLLRNKQDALRPLGVVHIMNGEDISLMSNNTRIESFIGTNSTTLNDLREGGDTALPTAGNLYYWLNQKQDALRVQSPLSMVNSYIGIGNVTSLLESTNSLEDWVRSGDSAIATTGAIMRMAASQFAQLNADNTITGDTTFTGSVSIPSMNDFYIEDEGDTLSNLIQFTSTWIQPGDQAVIYPRWDSATQIPYRGDVTLQISDPQYKALVHYNNIIVTLDDGDKLDLGSDSPMKYKSGCEIYTNTDDEYGFILAPTKPTMYNIVIMWCKLGFSVVSIDELTPAPEL